MNINSNAMISISEANQDFFERNQKVCGEPAR